MKRPLPCCAFWPGGAAVYFVAAAFGGISGGGGRKTGFVGDVCGVGGNGRPQHNRLFLVWLAWGGVEPGSR